MRFSTQVRPSMRPTRNRAECARHVMPDQRVRVRPETSRTAGRPSSSIPNPEKTRPVATMTTATIDAAAPARGSARIQVPVDRIQPLGNGQQSRNMRRARRSAPPALADDSTLNASPLVTRRFANPVSSYAVGQRGRPHTEQFGRTVRSRYAPVSEFQVRQSRLFF